MALWDSPEVGWDTREGLLAELPSPTLDPEQVRRVVEEVLARPEYREREPGFLQRLLDVVSEAVGRLLEAILGAGTTSPLGLIVLLVLAGAITVLVLRFASGMRRSAARGAELARGTGRSPRDWEAEAEEHEREGRWRDALRCRYRLMLASLAAQGLVDEIPGRTSGEYLAEARANLPAARAELEAVTAAFEQVWYGDQPADGMRAREVAGSVGHVVAVARGGGRHAFAGAGAGSVAGRGQA